MNREQETLNLINSVVINGSSHASHALTKWFGRRVHIHTKGLVEVSFFEVQDQMYGVEDPVVGIYHRIEGKVEGHLLLVFPEETGRSLVDIMMQQPVGTTTSIDEMGSSILQETGNIVSSAFTSSLADSLGVEVMPSVPELAHDYGAAILQPILQDQFQHGDEVLLMPSSFDFEDVHVKWMLYVLPTDEGFRRMQEILG